MPFSYILTLHSLACAPGDVQLMLLKIIRRPFSAVTSRGVKKILILFQNEILFEIYFIFFHGLQMI